MMTKEQLDIAKEALYQYELMRIKRLEALPSVEFQPSAEYNAKKEALKAKIKNNSLKKKYLTSRQKIGIMIAAVLLVTLIVTACAFRNQIKGFFVDFFETFASVDYIEDSLALYKDYELTWVSGNYIESNKVAFKDSLQIIYSNNDKKIKFTCHPMSFFNDIIDTQRAEFEIVYLGDNEIYYKEKNNLYTLYWVNEEVSFRLECSTDISWSEIEKMILSVECVK